MQLVADLHLHSKYSRAVSQNMTLPTMAQYAVQKGIDLLTVSDWTHPLWQKEIKEQLEEVGEGIYALKSEFLISKSETNPNSQNTKSKTPKFIFSTEISSIYKQGGKLRRIHSLVFVPSFSIAEKVSTELKRRGANLNADGRPIIGLSAKDLLSLILEIDERCMLIPAHVWTPHFGVYGSASGFDSLEEAFGDLKDSIYGIETGLSSDPEMNWQIEELQTRSILSFSDAHSPAKMGRELTIFEMGEISYENLRKAIMRPYVIASEAKQSKTINSKQLKSLHEIASSSSTSRNDNRVVYTVEFYPEEGKYHFSGHRNCKVVFGPEEIKKQGTICPTCGKRLTEGVLYRLQQLSNPGLQNSAQTKKNAAGLLWHTEKDHKHPPYVKLVPLLEVVAEANDSTVFSMKTKTQFDELLKKCGTELDILLKVPIDEIQKAVGEKIAEGVKRVRTGNIVINPGYDGEFGKVEIWKEGEESTVGDGKTPQLRLDF